MRALGLMATVPVATGVSGIRTATAPSVQKTTGRNSFCVLVPSETPGPFPLDLTDNVFFFRQDIREDRQGVQLRQKVRILGTENCEPMPNVRVNIWHCDRNGNYSGYGTELEQTYLRGYQMTDANGECEFVTIVPGWYPGRVTHVHFQVHVSTSYSAVSQWTWPHPETVAAVEDHWELYPQGPDPMTPEQDGVFADGFALQMADLTWDTAAQEYVSTYEAVVEGLGTNGVGHLERMTAGVIEVRQNAPNPFAHQTTIPFTLNQPASVRWSIWSPSGVEVHGSELGTLPAGEHRIAVNLERMALPSASYIYQLVAVTSEGEFSVVKRMTHLAI